MLSDDESHLPDGRDCDTSFAKNSLHEALREPQKMRDGAHQHDPPADSDFTLLLSFSLATKYL